MTDGSVNMTDESMRNFLLTWLVMHGTKFIDLDATTEVDDAIQDYMCYHWDEALEKGYVYNGGYTRNGELSEMSKLTRKGLAFINKVHEKEESYDSRQVG